MARIPDDDIARVKRDTDLLALVRSRGIELRKHGSKDFVGKCPFHDDNDSPNFIVSPAKGFTTAWPAARRATRSSSWRSSTA